ncbi:tryptophan 2,3-dioxygenase family protein [Algoriphagus halophytocola]|uniref:Tryptophan 2,3-dioxygenase family protein n=1 Tax=Algoriphagus halophytocola TaxID=2991499 RepID=A0ABY6MKV3_9BACT|nr:MULTISPECIES: tryptophan 2,3-dioxygenase family protein [unclassified Algoriphagus]UZD23740.1 tryptophan 2,3-dioxygenase family protein [Algoriphagus sp. TR-M5]WBL45034.1 tryptophan 2,3-dioxygenase family protein [Algoriphagus sp. TR-M9]
MDSSQFDPKILDKIDQLQKKFKASGQDMLSYLEGLHYADYLTYWDYINLDVLLSLQQPKTSFPDEKIFIIYHQITELYFKLIISEMEQIADKQDIKEGYLMVKLERINMYFDHLISSFAMMWKGMEQEQFLKFRMSLLPSSGFQSAQYREIELMATDAFNLVALDKRADPDFHIPTDEIFENLYWQQGAIELATGEKTLTLKNFEAKYSKKLMDLIDTYRRKNLWHRYMDIGNPSRELTEEMKKFDLKANVFWPLAHYKSAVRFLQRDPVDIAATGGTNWQKYLPPRFQKVIFFPELWTEQEKEDWGKGWVVKEIFGEE